MTKAAIPFATFWRLNCPACGAWDVRRAHRHSPGDWLLSLFTIRPYLCQGCNRRFHALPSLRAIAPTRRENLRRDTRPHPSRRRTARWPRLARGTIRHAILALGALLGAFAFLLFISRHSS